MTRRRSRAQRGAIHSTIVIFLLSIAIGCGDTIEEDPGSDPGLGGSSGAGGVGGLAGSGGESGKGGAGSFPGDGDAGASGDAGAGGSTTAGTGGSTTAGAGGSTTAGTGGSTTAGAGGSTTAGAGGSTTAGAGGDAGASDTGGAAGSESFVPTPVRKIPGLESITFYETTGSTQAYTFFVDGPELSVKLADPLNNGNRDIQGTSVEFYDVYYSDKEGVFAIDGAYLTISGSFGATLPAGGGLNLAEISLNYQAGSQEYGNYVASFVALGDNAVPGNVDNCIDGDLNTWTTMGNTVGTSERLRLTLGFESSSGKP